MIKLTGNALPDMEGGDPRLWRHPNPVIEALIRRVEILEEEFKNFKLRDNYFKPEEL